MITAAEVVSPIGSDAARFATALGDGTVGIAAEPAGAALPCAARIGEFGAKQIIPAASLRRMPRATQLLLVATRRLLEAGGGLPCADDRIGLVVGTGLGTLEESIAFQRGYLDKGPEAASPLLFPVSVMNAPAGQIAVECGLKGVNSTVNHRDGSPLGALLFGADLLRFGRADAVLVGAVDELSAVTSDAYARLAAPAPDALRPYDRQRTGLVPGEVATVLLLERESDARRRGATIRARLAAWSQTGDDRPRLGWGAPAAWPGAVRAVAQVGAGVDWIVGQGNGTSLDESELAVYHAAFPAGLPPVTSILGQIGECMATGLARVLAAIVGMEQRRLLPTIGTTSPIDPAVVTRAREQAIAAVLVASFAQGGANLAVRLERA